MKSVLIIMFLTLSAFAAEESEESIFGETKESQDVQKNIKFHVGPDYYQTVYREDSLGVKINGNMYGAAGSAMYDGVVFSSIDFRLAEGSLNYSSDGTGSGSGHKDLAFEIRLPFGKTFHFSPMSVRPYLGLAYRFLQDDSAGTKTSTGHVGYKREANYYYAPLGLTFETELFWDLSLTLNGEYDYFLSGLQKSYLNTADEGYNTVENKQQKGMGYRTSVTVQEDFSNLSVFLTPYYRIWHIKDSDRADITWYGVKIGEGYEPDNKTREMGLTAGVEF